MTVAERRQIATTMWLITGLCVGLFVSGPDLWSALSAVIACAVCGAATYDWLMSL